MSNFELLPVEILCLIFDYLGEEDLKNSSLVCRRWCDVIFSDHYIRRFMLRIDVYSLVKTTKPMTYQARSAIYDLLSLLYSLFRQTLKGTFLYESGQTVADLWQSGRQYRNVVWVWDEDIETNQFTLYDVTRYLLRPSGLEHLEILKIILVEKFDVLAKLLNRAVKNMTRLKSFQLVYDPMITFLEGMALQPGIEIESQSITHVELKFVIPDDMRLPKLDYLDVNLRYDIVDMIKNSAHNLQTLHFHVDCALVNCGEAHLYTLTLDRLTNLKLSRKYMNEFSLPNPEPNSMALDLRVRFFRRLNKLQKLILEETFTTEHIFLAICETSRNLVELKIDHLKIDNCTVLDKLSLLPNLKSLSLLNIHFTDEISFRNVDLPKLESLFLEELKDSSYSFCKFVNLKSLSVGSFATCAPELTKALSMHLQKLLDLRLYFMDCILVPADTFRPLTDLGQLRTLELVRGHLTRDVFGGYPIGRSQVETIVFYHCQLETKYFVGMRRLFPRVKDARFEECNLRILR